MANSSKLNLKDIRLLVLDVDGVLTNGTLVINADGSESKLFNTLDGHGIRMWRRAGMKVAFLSGRESEPTNRRAEQLGVDYCIQDSHEKLPSFEKLLAQVNLSANQAAYIGDDLPDLPVVRRAGFGVAVANAVDEVRQYADYVTTRRGGSGAVREVIEYILKDIGVWDELTSRYFPSQT